MMPPKRTQSAKPGGSAKDSSSGPSQQGGSKAFQEKLLSDVLTALEGPVVPAAESATATYVRRLWPEATECCVFFDDGSKKWMGVLPLEGPSKLAAKMQDLLLEARVSGFLKELGPNSLPQSDEPSVEVSLLEQHPGNALAQLRAVQDSVYKVSIDNANAEAFRLICAMPRLRHLTLDMWDDASDGAPSVAPSAFPAGLLYLHTRTVARPTLQGLLMANRNSLTELHLSVGTPGHDLGWRKSCEDLHDLLMGCGMAKLRFVVLYRLFLQHTRKGCERQLKDLGRALPRVASVCMDCYRKPLV